MAVLVINNTASHDDLVSILIVFGAYPRMYNIDLSVLTIIQSATAIKKTIDKVRKIWAKNQMVDALKTRNRSLVDFIRDFSLNFDILVWQEDNISWNGK